MKSISLGPDILSDIYIGSQQMSAVYAGDTLVWSAGPQEVTSIDSKTNALSSRPSIYSFNISDVEFQAGDVAYYYLLAQNQTGTVVTSAGWTLVLNTNGYGGNGTVSFKIYSKVMDGTETEIVTDAGSTAVGWNEGIAIFRNAAVCNPATDISQFGSTSIWPDPPAVQSAVNPEDIVLALGSVCATSGFTVQSGYTGLGFTDVVANTQRMGAGMSYKSNPNPSENPPAFVSGGGNLTFFGGRGVTIAVRAA